MTTIRSDLSESRRQPVLTLVKSARLIIALVLWTATLFFAVTALGRLAGIFTGDESFGAYDGFQFTDALYGATARFALAIVTAYLVWRVLRWSPGRGRRESGSEALVGHQTTEEHPGRVDDEIPVIGDDVVEST